MQEAFNYFKKRHPALAPVMASEFAHSAQWNSFGHFGVFTSHLWDWIDFTLQAAEEAGKRAKRGDPKDELLTFAANTTRWASHQWTLFHLLQQGRYGECHAIGRMLLEQTDLIVLLASDPSSVPDWVDSTSTPGQPVPQRWQPRSIRRKIEQIGAKSYESSLYSQMSAAVHPSSWGNSMYSARVGGAQVGFVVTPMATFDPLRALELLGMGLRTVPLPLFQFLRIADRKGFPAKVRHSFMDRYSQRELMWALTAKFSGEMGALLRNAEAAAATTGATINHADLNEQIEGIRKRIFETETEAELESFDALYDVGSESAPE